MPIEGVRVRIWPKADARQWPLPTHCAHSNRWADPVKKQTPPKRGLCECRNVLRGLFSRVRLSACFNVSVPIYLEENVTLTLFILGRHFHFVHKVRPSWRQRRE